ncbi:hypothetical protein SCT_1534 [Sulfuricella sp. T08]|nr:hypothetical protein SCT_1534 [Sulfuricella sp. T08]
MECRLADVAKVDSGAGFPLQYQGTQDAVFPFLKVSDMNLAGNEREIQRWNNSVSDEVRGKLRAKAFPAGSLIFPKIGAAIGTNKKRQLTQPSCADNNVMAVIPKPELLEPDFLYFLFLAKNISDFASDSNPPSIRKSEVENWQVQVPTLSEQRRIVDILSRAEGIVRLRREAERKAAELVPGIFLDMFGDPATNPRGWPVESLGKHVGIPSVVRTPDLAAEADMLCIGADSIESMSGKLISMPTVRDVLPKSGKYWFDAGDALYSKIRPYLAKATLVQTGGYCSADMYPLRCGITLRPTFLLSLLLSKAFTEYATAESVRASMPKLNRVALFKYQFPLPPVRLQEIFSEHAEAMQAIQFQQSTATDKAKATFDALLAQVFS